MLLLGALVLVLIAFVTGYGVGVQHSDSQSREAQIGANTVPAGLECEEDEVIGFVQEGTPPYSLGCVHVDSIRSDG